jgi:hypothetical protein
VPLSTSNSKPAAPTGPWGRIWICCLAICLLTIAGLGTLWRSQGHRPSIVDNVNFWSYWRARLSPADRNTVAIVGTSRIQLAFAPRVWKKRFPNHPCVDLAIAGTQPVATIQDLAEDAEFRGTVLYELPASLVGWQLEDQRPYVEHYHKEWTLRKAPETLLQAFVQSQLVCISPNLDLASLASALAQRKWPPKLYSRLLWDRSRRTDAVPMKPSSGEAIRDPEVLSEKQHATLRDLRQAIEQIRAKGGEVILIRTPTCGSAFEEERQRYPRREYWDDFTRTDGARAVSFEEIPGLESLHCGDGSHLAEKSADKFTAALAEELVRRGLIEP